MLKDCGRPLAALFCYALSPAEVWAAERQVSRFLPLKLVDPSDFACGPIRLAALCPDNSFFYSC